jgi:hypothetical protein
VQENVVAPRKFQELLHRGLAELGGTSQRKLIFSIELQRQEPRCLCRRGCRVPSSDAYEVSRKPDIPGVLDFRIAYGQSMGH